MRRPEHPSLGTRLSLLHKVDVWTKSNIDRRRFIGGSDARIIMCDDESTLLRLWREKQGETEPKNLSCNFIV